MAQYFNPTCLSTIRRSTHPDLQRITSEKLILLLEEYPQNLIIIDARFPFEHAGGHIRESYNIHTEEQLHRLFNGLVSSIYEQSPIIIFHCEYSSERGPRLCRLFRSLDRSFHLNDYPNLSFPFVYLLDGGYAEFYQSTTGKCWCEPQAYISMFDQVFDGALKRHRQAKKIASGRLRMEQHTPIKFQI